MSATVDIITEERLGVITIPIQALTTPRPGKALKRNQDSLLRLVLTENRSGPVESNLEIKKLNQLLFLF